MTLGLFKKEGFFNKTSISSGGSEPFSKPVLCSRNYDAFGHKYSNREIKETHVARLMVSMKEVGFLPSHHIICDANLNIIDGQHRFEAAKNLGLEIWYMIDQKVNEEMLIKLNDSVCKWKVKDRMKHYCALGKKEYVELAKFADELGIDYTWILDLLGPEESHRVSGFNAGSLKFNEDTKESLRKRLLDIKIPFEYLNNLRPDKKFKFGKKLIVALDKFLTKPGIEVGKLMHRLEIDGTKFVRQNSVSKYIEMFEKIYNFRSKK
jgi:hypothetical protein